jgi:hypothetical protein
LLRHHPGPRASSGGLRAVNRPDFTVWAPRPEELALAIWPVTGDDPESGTPVIVAMDRDDDGWWHRRVHAGSRRGGGLRLPALTAPRPHFRSALSSAAVWSPRQVADLRRRRLSVSDEQWYGRQLAGGGDL